MRDVLGDVVTLAHGNGGRLMRQLIEEVFAPAFGPLETGADATPVALGGSDLLVTTDGFTVQPLEFPGGDIGRLAVHGTVNDLAVAGAKPLYVTVAMLIEEGFAVSRLRRIAASLGRAARDENIRVVAGDTKILPRGQCGGLFLVLTGIGVPVAGVRLGLQEIRPGDRILLSGPAGDHGVAVMLARQEYGLRSEISSDSASVRHLTEGLLGLPGLRFMRDPTRGGVATVAHEIARGTGLGVRLETVPVREEVASVCAILGFDPLYLACEGRVMAVVSARDSGPALAAWRALGAQAALIGTIAGEGVTLVTELGGSRFLPELEADALPRIC